MGNISIWQLLILLLIVVLVFGTKRLRNIGGDLGNAVKGFRKGMEDDDDEDDSPKELGTEEADATRQQRASETRHEPPSDR